VATKIFTITPGVPEFLVHFNSSTSNNISETTPEVHKDNNASQPRIQATPTKTVVLSYRINGTGNWQQLASSGNGWYNGGNLRISCDPSDSIEILVQGKVTSWQSNTTQGGT
jgi:hypothetical protein